MAARLKGQEVSIRTVVDGEVVTAITAIGSYNDEVSMETKEDGFLGEKVNRVDYILNSYGGDFEFQIDNGTWYVFRNQIISKATRENPALVFNVIITEEYTDGTTNVITFIDVAWGAIPRNIPSRADFVKVKMSFKASQQDAQVDALPA